MAAEAQRPKRRLFLGEGDFSYTLAFINKHPDLAELITATEYYSEDELKGFPDYLYIKKIVDEIKEKGVTVQFEVDATKLDKKYKGEIFQRIQFNAPWFHTVTCDLVFNFFKSAAKIQDEGHRIQMRLLTKYLQEYKVSSACASAGYKLLKIRKFKYHGEEESWGRYPGYRHRVSTGSLHNICGKYLEGYEYVFQKSSNENFSYDVLPLESGSSGDSDDNDPTR